MIGDYVEILSGYAFNSSQFNDEGKGIPIVRIRDVGNDRVATYFDGNFSEDYLLKNGDFLIGMDGNFRLAEWKGGEALLNQRVCKIIPNEQKINARYLLFLLPKELKKIEDSTSFATVKHLSVKKIKNIQIPLPPLETQKKIAAILDAADAYRQKTKTLIAKYEALTQSVFLEMFGDPVRNEKGWEKKTILELVNPARPITYGILMPKENIKPEGIPYIKVVDVKNGEILDDQVCHTSAEIEGKYKRSRLKKGDVLISIRGHVGRVCLVPKRYEDANITQDTARLDFNESIMPSFAEGCLNTIEFQRYMSRFVKGAGVKGINLGDLKKLEIPVPHIKNQKLFDEEILSIKKQKAQAQQSLEKAEELFNSLLQRAFKGELV